MSKPRKRVLRRTAVAWWRWYDESNPSASEPLSKSMRRCSDWVDGKTDDGPPVEWPVAGTTKPKKASKPEKSSKPKKSSKLFRRFGVSVLIEAEVRFPASPTADDVMEGAVDAAVMESLNSELRSWLASESRARLSLHRIRSLGARVLPEGEAGSRESE